MGDNVSDADDDGVQARRKWTAVGEPSVAVVEAIAESTGRDPAAVTPLYETVDPDALDAVVTARNGDESIRASFIHDGVAVTVDSDGGITVQPVTGTSD